MQLLYLGGKNRKGSEERGKEIGACRGLSGEEFWCCLLPARSSRGGVHLGRPVLGRATMRGVSHGGCAARERELGRAAAECSQRFFLSAVNGKFHGDVINQRRSNFQCYSSKVESFDGIFLNSESFSGMNLNFPNF